MKTTASENFYRSDIDGLRALAVLMVVVYHVFPKLLRGGFVGVDIFFVISGFLITGIILRDLDNGCFSFWNFYSRRIRRIFPALILVLCVTLAFGWFSLFADEYKMLGKHVFGGVSFTANIFYWWEAGYWDVNSKLKPLLHLWSLGIEEQFYIVFPCLLVLVRKKNWRLLTVIILLTAFSFALNIYYYRRNPILDFYAPFTRFWEILSGGTLAFLLQKESPFLASIGKKADAFLAKIFGGRHVENDGRNLRNALSILGFILLVVAVRTSRVDRHFPGYRALLPVMGTVFLIAAGQSAYLNRTLFSNKIAVWIGLISYPLYLWHWPLISYATILNGEFSGEWEWRFIRFGCILFACFAAFMTYKFVESPIRFGKKKRQAKIYILVAIMTALSCAGMLIFLKNGLPERGSMAHYNNTKEGLQIPPPPRRNETGKQYAPNFPCQYTDAGSSRTVAVIGDSHAQSAYPGIAKENARLGLNTFYVSYVFRESKETMERTLALLAIKKDIRHVFLFYRGVLYLKGNDIDGYENYETAPLDKFEPFLQKTIDALKAMGKEVFIVSENPVFSRSAREYVIRPFVLSRKQEPPKLKKEDVLAHQKEYLDLLGRLEGATVIYSLDVFCPQGECMMFSQERVPLYYDDDHLSIAGSHYQAQHLLAPILARIAKE